jgi:acetate kinase
MADAIIVINAGSSSLKFSMYAIANTELNLLVGGQVEGLGTSPRFKAKDANGQVLADLPLESRGETFEHSQAFDNVARWLQQHYGQQYSPVGIGHRIVHGGAKFTSPVLIDDKVLHEIEKLVPLMPLHLPPNLAAVRAVKQTHRDLPQVACFDTAFHRGREGVTERFGLPDELFQQGIRRWGFHGLSYEFIASQLPGISLALAQGRVIVAHLGSGASLCAIRGGQCVDTTMSFSALDGLPMGTRCGSLDPGVILFLLQRGMSPSEIEDLLYRKSGLLGISGVSNDVRDLLKSDNPRAAEALEFFAYRIIREIGSLTAALGGLDALIFTAGIGEKSPFIRQRVCQGLGWLNIAIDTKANEQHRKCISPAGQVPSVWVIPTDEEAVLSSHTLRIVRSLGHMTEST